MKVDLINYMGDDLMVVNAARVSFNKTSSWDDADHLEYDEQGAYLPYVLKASDKKLIDYLARNGHWTPFSHPQITLRVKAPIFVARQLFKHKVGLTENEVSRRYVDDDPEFFYPSVWRGRPTDGAKQGSSGELSNITQELINIIVSHLNERAFSVYNSLLAGGVAPEQARMVLPQAMYTEWYWTGSLAAYARVANLRLDSHAQSETRDVAQMISDIIEPLFPVSWAALTS